MSKLLKLLFLIAYVFILFYLVFFARRRESMHLLQREKLVNVVPLVHKLSEYGNIEYPRESFNFFSNLIGNIFLFMPLPFFMAGVFRMNDGKLILFFSFLLSLFIEITQLVFKAGVADIDDILLNTLGAFIGLLMLKAIVASSKN